jgi:type IV pilus assembly protein PilA
VQSDLTNAKTAVIAYLTDKNTLPGVSPDATALTPGALGTYGFTFNTADEKAPIAYSPSAPSAGATTFCIKAQGITGNDFYVTDSTGVVKVASGGTAPTNC